MNNVRGSLLMVAAMLGFALEDVVIKQMALHLPMGQVVALIGCGGAVIFAVLTRVNGRAVAPRVLFSRVVLLRNLGELIASAGFVSAFVLTSLSSASAILQATPLAVTLGAALILGEDVGWRRWTAIAVGFSGVLLIIQPGLAGFAPASLLAVMAVAGLALRDLVTRAVPREVSGVQLTLWGYVAVIPAGLLLLLFTGETPQLMTLADLALLIAAFVVGGVGYYALVGATRTGEVSVVVSFRYSRLLFALLLGAVVFGERPEPLMLVGAALIVAAGLYTMYRETRKRSQPAPESNG